MNQNKQKLDEWYKSISNVKKLKLEETKKLLIDMSVEKDKNKRLKIRNLIIEQTLYIVYRFINKYGISHINDSYIDIDDVISVCCEEWINIIDSYRLLSADSFSDLYVTINNNLNKKLFGNIRTSYVEDEELMILFQYFKNSKNLVLDKSEYDDSLMLHYGYSYDDTNKILTEVYKILNSEEEVEISMKQLLLLKKILINLVCKNNEYENTDSIVINYDIDTKLYSEEFRNNILPTLPVKEQEVLKLRYGFYNGNIKSYKEIADILGISVDRVRNIEQRAIKRLKNPAYTNKLRIK